MRPQRRKFKFSLSSRSVFVIAVGLLLGIGLSQSLSGCSAESSPVHQLMSSLRWGAMPQESRAQVDRFKDAVAQHVADDEDLANQMPVFAETLWLVSSQYVHETQESDLVDAAIAGVEVYAKPPVETAEPTDESSKKINLAPVRDPDEPLTAERLVEVGLNALLRSLDPHSSYLNPAANREMRVSNSGKFGGLGIEVTMGEQGVKVVAPIEDTPAARAGLQAGDVITHVDGQSLVGWTLFKAVGVMRGAPGEPILLTIVRAESAPFDVTIIRAIIVVRAVRYRIEGDVGYVRVAKFTENAEDGLIKAMDALEQQMGAGLKGYVIDLRNNPGGLLDQSVAISDSFLESGGIVTVRQRGGADIDRYDATSGDLARGRPVVVLIGPGSASASEIVAAAIQDNKRGLVMGEQSFGKGSVQSILPMVNQGALRLTTALYYTPSDRSIQALGVTPDVIVARESRTNSPAFPKESDLPQSIRVKGQMASKRGVTVDRDQCEPIKVRDREDRQLGCAMALVRAGSLPAFLKDIGVKAAAFQ